MIQWNKVTWYSKLLWVIFIIGVLPAWTFYMVTQYKEVASMTKVAPPTVLLKRTITLGLNEKRTIAGTVISPVAVHDSRCPVGVQCIWAGKLVVDILVGDKQFSLEPDMSTTTEILKITFKDMATNRFTFVVESTTMAGI